MPIESVGQTSDHQQHIGLVTISSTDASCPGMKVLYQLHNCPSGTHLGVAKTAAKMILLARVAERHMSQRKECLKKGPKRPPTITITSILIGKPFDMFAMDICASHRLGQQVHSCGSRLLSKWPKCYVIPDQEAKTIAYCLEEFISITKAPFKVLPICVGKGGANEDQNHIKDISEVQAFQPYPFN